MEVLPLLVWILCPIDSHMFAARGAFGGGAVVDGALWVFGGYGGTGGYYKDLWSLPLEDPTASLPPAVPLPPPPTALGSELCAPASLHMCTQPAHCRRLRLPGRVTAGCIGC